MPELIFSASRSGGPGGQHVNKTSTKVTLQFDVRNSSLLSEDAKRMLLDKLGNRISKEGILTLSGQARRSQLQNKRAVLKKLDMILAKAFEIRKVRKPTKPSKKVIAKRLKQKKIRSEKKKWRQKPGQHEA